MMTVKYNLGDPSYKAIGITRTGYQYAGHLHEGAGKVKNETRTSSPDIDAPPQESSDEASVKAEDHETIYDAIIEADARRSGSRSPQGSTSGRSKGPVFRPEPATIPSTNFSSFTESGGSNGPQSSQKRGRNRVGEVDEDMSGVWSQKKRVRTGYGGSSQRSTQDNIHHSSVRDPTKKSTKQSHSSDVTNGKVSMRFLQGTEDAIATVDNLPPKEEIPTFKKLSSAETTTRETRAQARSSHNIQSSSQGSQKSTSRVLKQTSPHKAKLQSAYRVLQGTSDNPNLARATRSNKTTKRSLMFADSDAIPVETNEHPEEPMDIVELAKEQFAPSTEVRNAAQLAQGKLGLLAKPYKPPPSSKTESSLPSTSMDDASSDSPLSSLSSETSEISETVDLSPTQKNIEYVKKVSLVFEKDRNRKCPICKESIDQVFWERYPNVDRRRIREQAQFCKAHKKHTAEVSWEEQCFPKIDWQLLDERLKDYHNAVDDILQGRRISFYRNAFEDLVKSRNERTLRKDLMNGNEIEELVPGYYGSRGAKIMVENIMARFAPKLRRLAASDKLIASGGVSGYVQAVLVPELAVLLVMDDMNVDQDEAREILRGSIDLGNLLNEEEDELIIDNGEDMKVLLDQI